MESSNAMAVKSAIGMVIGRVKCLATMGSSLATLVRDKRRVDGVYEESIDALRDWECKEHERLDKLEEAVRNRYQSIDVESNGTESPQITGVIDNTDSSSDAKSLIEEINLALKAWTDIKIGKSSNMIELKKDSSATMLR